MILLGVLQRIPLIVPPETNVVVSPGIFNNFSRILPENPQENPFTGYPSRSANGTVEILPKTPTEVPLGIPARAPSGISLGIPLTIHKKILQKFQRKFL